MSAEQVESASVASPTAIVDVGWVIAGRLDAPDLEAVHETRQQVLDLLQRHFPEYRWRMPIVHREELPQGIRVEPVDLLDHGLAERDIKHWDFTLVLTGADLHSYTKPYCLAVISRAFDAAVCSTLRIDPASNNAGLSQQVRCEVITKRLTPLVLHAFGHLNGLEHSEDPTSYQYNFTEAEDLDRMVQWTDDDLVQLQENFRVIADLRLEESGSYNRLPAWRFYIHVAMQNRHEIWQSIVHARPWEFPYRLSRLTVAALSTTFVLLMTAEAWELGMSQTVLGGIALPILAVVATTIYVVKRQNLLSRRSFPKLTEQSAITRLSTIAIVMTGMLTTLIALFGFSLFFSIVFYPQALVENWAASVRPIEISHYVIFSLFAATFGIAIGALGASFEGQRYFRHVTYVDEEA